METISDLLWTSKNETEKIMMKTQVPLAREGRRISVPAQSMSDFLQDSLRNEDDSIKIDQSEAHTRNLRHFGWRISTRLISLLGTWCSIFLKLGSARIFRNCCFIHMAQDHPGCESEKIVVDCDEYFVGKPGASFDAELVVRALENGWIEYRFQTTW